MLASVFLEDSRELQRTRTIIVETIVVFTLDVSPTIDRSYGHLATDTVKLARTAASVVRLADILSALPPERLIAFLAIPLYRASRGRGSVCAL